tara:strand:+ start:14093 stop:14848 length:756 start_codon:yes stop_codon:yes gene_type:complete
VTPDETIELLQRFKAGQVKEAEVLQRLCSAPIDDLGFAQIDAHRPLRQGFPEVIFGSNKTPEQVAAIVTKVIEREARILVTRAESDHAAAVREVFPNTIYHETAKCITVETKRLTKRQGLIAVICAGTSDLPVADEAAVTAEFMGNTVARVNDVGVAGLHRLLSSLPIIREASIVIAVAGMEGALPSVVAGLVCRPVIAVPTSVGYGANFGGMAALLGMLNSCGSGVTVVNIDNGFGAGFAANQINALANS